jgi:N-acetylated-alpha-linked acidic dipeptidase
LTGSRPLVSVLVLSALLPLAAQTLRPEAVQPVKPSTSPAIFGFRDFTRQAQLDAQFLAVPDPALARQHLQVLTAVPHWASSPADHATALYVAERFRAAGLQTEIVPYSVLISRPTSILVEAFNTAGAKIFSGPPQTSQDAPAFNSGSPSGDITAPVVYANYGRIEDFEQLAQLGISLKGRIALIRYGSNFRGVKVYLAERYGAAAVLLYSDPADDGPATAAAYPAGPRRPDSAAQLGSVQFLPIYPGDPTTPGVASIPNLPTSQRIPTDKLQYDLPTIPVDPLSAADAAPILRALGGPVTPHEWQGGLPFAYHLGGSDTAPITVHLRLVEDARLRTIWDVIGKIPGTTEPRQWVIAGNHRDAWVYGAADPGSGTAAMLETVHGLGVLLHSGWRPRRTIVLASWDGEEQGLMGSTEWVEQHPAELAQAAAYFNLDVAVSGPLFTAAAVPSLRRFLSEIAAEVPAAAGGTVLDQWRRGDGKTPPTGTLAVADLGSGSDYTPFLQHAGVPSTDIESDGPFGVYHTHYDSFDWFTRFADPTFVYTQQQSRFFGLEILHMADADALPYDYRTYADEIRGYLDHVRTRATAHAMTLDFSAASTAAQSFATAARATLALQSAPPASTAALNRALIAAEHAFLLPAGLPRRPWYRHSIFAPGEFTGYEAVVLPGITDAIDAGDATRAQAQLQALAQTLNRASAVLNAPLQ